MSWSKVTKGKKPIGWWYHKIMCEFGWIIRRCDICRMYYKHLNKMCDKYKINLYGQHINKSDILQESGEYIIDRIARKYISAMARQLDIDILNMPINNIQTFDNKLEAKEKFYKETILPDIDEKVKLYNIDNNKPKPKGKKPPPPPPPKGRTIIEGKQPEKPPKKTNN